MARDPMRSRICVEQLACDGEIIPKTKNDQIMCGKCRRALERKASASKRTTLRGEHYVASATAKGK
jgi:hypothetical protein